MKTFNKDLLEKFFDGTCSPEQAEVVLDWLDTPEGQKYLDERLHNELNEWEADEENVGQPKEKEKRNQAPDNNPIDSALLFQKIMQRLGWSNLQPKRRVFFQPLIQVAASLLVIATATLFYIYAEGYNADEAIPEPVTYSTSSEQQKRITLRDGSIIQLNENSSITIDHDYNSDNRNVTLSGEAFFDVIHEPQKPFMVNSDQSVIEVLGTSFNMKINSDKPIVDVAVTEGRVSLRHIDADQGQATLLEKGHFASLNTTTREVQIDNYGIDNYLAWKSGRLVFEGMRMETVCRQLNRLYEISCLFNDSAIKDRKLTANFPSESLEKVLSVVGLSLNLTYDINGSDILWNSGNPSK